MISNMAKNRPILLVGVIAIILLLVGGIFIISRNSSTPAVEDKIANAPIGCPSSTSVVVKSPEAGTQNISTANSIFMQWTNSTGALIFTNYTLNPDSIYSNITEDRVLTVVKLSHEDDSNLAEGTFRKTAPDGEETPNKYSSEYNISTEDLAGAVFDDNSTVEIDYFGSDYVCGTITSQDSSSGINGQFIAKYIDKIY